MTLSTSSGASMISARWRVGMSARSIVMPSVTCVIVVPVSALTSRSLSFPSTTGPSGLSLPPPTPPCTGSPGGRPGSPVIGPGIVEVGVGVGVGLGVVVVPSSVGVGVGSGVGVGEGVVVSPPMAGSFGGFGRLGVFLSTPVVVGVGVGAGVSAGVGVGVKIEVSIGVVVGVVVGVAVDVGVAVGVPFGLSVGASFDVVVDVGVGVAVGVVVAAPVSSPVVGDAVGVGTGVATTPIPEDGRFGRRGPESAPVDISRRSSRYSMTIAARARICPASGRRWRRVPFLDKDDDDTDP